MKSTIKEFFAPIKLKEFWVFIGTITVLLYLIGRHPNSYLYSVLF